MRSDLTLDPSDNVRLHNSSSTVHILEIAGVGGQVDFIRGAALGYDALGKPILGMPSVTKNGDSKIVPYVKQGKPTLTCLIVLTSYGIKFCFHVLPTWFWF